MIVRVFASIALLAASDGVERSSTGAPIAFRIWRAGANVTDHGTHIFSAASARDLMAEQSARGNLYSIDVDHLSLSKEAPPEARKAVGFHRLEVRQSPDGPELWATAVEWTDAVRGGLEKNPPEWRYFSPAYDVNKKTGEIASYLNLALTNNPATWGVTALASLALQRGTMDYKEIAAALFGDDDEKKKEAKKCISGMSELEKKAYKAAVKAAFADEPDGDEKKDEPEKKEETKASEEPTPEKKDEKKEETASKAAIAATSELATTVAKQQKEIDEFKAERLAKQRAEVLATRKDLPESLVATLAKMPIDLMVETIKGIPVPDAADPAAATRVTATRGSSHADSGGYGATRAARLPPAQHQELRERMSGEPAVRAIGWDKDHPNDLVFPQIDKAEARRVLAARAKAGTDGPARNPANK